MGHSAIGRAVVLYTTGFRFESGCPDSISGRMTTLRKDDIVLSDGTQRRSEGEKAMNAFNFNFSQISCSSQRSHQIIRWFVRVRMKSGELMS